MEKAQFPCPKCGAQFEYDPGASALKCPYCGSESAVPKPAAEIRELDYKEFLEKASSERETQERLEVMCGACGAESTLEPNVTGSSCPFCGSAIVSTAASKKVIKPEAVLPFKVTRAGSEQSFRQWLNRLWFAPSGIKKNALRDHPIQGMYLPYWTYDCTTTSYYTGERGEDYWVNQPVTVMQGGRRVTRTSRVRKTRWHPAAGYVYNKFDDVLVLASKSLPTDKVQKLEPWDTKAFVLYDDSYLSGYRTESYTVSLKDGFETARAVMDAAIQDSVRRDIGGDQQRIHSVKSQYDQISFKHVLLPVWISAYRFKNKVFRFLVNARTGEVQAERPWSVAKIMLAILGAAGFFILLYLLLGKLG